MAKTSGARQKLDEMEAYERNSAQNNRSNRHDLEECVGLDFSSESNSDVEIEI